MSSTPPARPRWAPGLFSALGGLLFATTLQGCLPLGLQGAVTPAPSAAPASQGSAAVVPTATAPEAPSTAAVNPEEEVELEEDVPEDGSGTYAMPNGAPSPHPLDGWTAERIAEVVRHDPSELGSLSVGATNAGALVNGIQAQANAFYQPVDPEGTYGTEETLRYLEAAIQRVHAEFPNTPPLWLGDISARNGGHLSPHVSHQAGRDVDISFYYQSSAPWYQRGTRRNLDLPRTWAFVRALITETDVELILIDHSIQKLLREHALAIGEDRDWVDSVFRGNPEQLSRPIIRHAKGHATHIHVRFFNPIAQESGRRCYAALIEAEKIKPPVSYIRYKAKRGDSLIRIAKKFHVTVPQLRAANGLKNDNIREAREYRIPVRRGAAAPTALPLTFPTRRLPPAPVRHADTPAKNNRG